MVSKKSKIDDLRKRGKSEFDIYLDIWSANSADAKTAETFQASNAAWEEGEGTPSPFAFPVGQRIEKHHGGSYRLPGVIAARFLADDGEPHYVVYHKPIAPGRWKIYAEGQLRAKE